MGTHQGPSPSSSSPVGPLSPWCWLTCGRPSEQPAMVLNAVFTYSHSVLTIALWDGHSDHPCFTDKEAEARKVMPLVPGCTGSLTWVVWLQSLWLPPRYLTDCRPCSWLFGPASQTECKLEPPGLLRENSTFKGCPLEILIWYAWGGVPESACFPSAPSNSQGPLLEKPCSYHPGLPLAPGNWRKSRPGSQWLRAQAAPETEILLGLCVSVCVHAKLLQLCLSLCDPSDCSPPGSSVHGDSPGKNNGVACHALLQGIFLTQGSNPCLLRLLHCQDLYNYIPVLVHKLLAQCLRITCSAPS